ncbi:MAG: hypothetical protein IJG51_04995 [Synergistaceae bacterium]|nr:hypothetical protein [Synergistaceae bacterium]MBQ3398221.1 hypothetical protein [Synergistaceae bacterium]MBQ4400748.1 hypothetical protein [Synergistaceae bacterium]MBQ6664508.1 hypothetical protein [Synergistaceae bacterium]MBQ6980926.1 hypothetical protein [Synergistaceae bacterium]
MTQRKVLGYFTIEGAPGGNQDWLPEWEMNMGGCAAVTACDTCIFLSRKDEYRSLYPFNPEKLSRSDFIKFASIMKPYLSPRYHGIDFLETYICGLYDYMASAKNTRIILEGVSANVPYDDFASAIMNQLDRNLPVPFLLLHHKNPKLDDFQWHWFNLAGYDDSDGETKILTVTYGEYQWFGLREIYETGYERRGGLIKLLLHTSDFSCELSGT